MCKKGAFGLKHKHLGSTKIKIQEFRKCITGAQRKSDRNRKGHLDILDYHIP